MNRFSASNGLRRLRTPLVLLLLFLSVWMPRVLDLHAFVSAG